MAPPLHAVAGLSLIVSAAAAGGSLPGIGDHAALMQTSARVKGSATKTTNYNRQLKSLLESKEVKELMEKHSPRRSDEDMARDLRGTVEALRKSTRANTKREAPHRPAAPSTLPPELEAMKMEMRAALRQLAPDPSQAVMLLQQSGLPNNLTQAPQEELERVSQHIARTSKSIQENTALHEQLLERIPLLHGLIADSWFSEPLRGHIANASVGQMLQGPELAVHMPELFGRGAAALKSLSMKDGAQADPGAAEPSGRCAKTAAEIAEEERAAEEQPRLEPSIAFDTTHGVKFAPKSGYGWGGEITVGVGKTAFLAQVPYPPHSLASAGRGIQLYFCDLSKIGITIEAGVSFVTDSGTGVIVWYSFTVAAPEEGMVGPKRFPWVVDNGIRIKVTRKDITASPPLSDTGITASYATFNAVGAGLKVNIAPDDVEKVVLSPKYESSREWIPDFFRNSLANTFDFDSANVGTSFNGWRFGTQYAAHLDMVDDWTINQFAFSSKTIYAPEDERSFPDIAFKLVKTLRKESEETEPLLGGPQVTPEEPEVPPLPNLPPVQPAVEATPQEEEQKATAKVQPMEEETEETTQQAEETGTTQQAEEETETTQEEPFVPPLPEGPYPEEEANEEPSRQQG